MSRNPSSAMRTDLDDWETDPDFVRDMDETTQRWGNSRTVGSINMNDLIDQVRKDHQAMRDKFYRSTRSEDFDKFGANLGVKNEPNNRTGSDYDYHKESKHTSEEFRKVVTSSSISNSTGGLSSDGDTRKSFMDKADNEDSRAKSQFKSKPTPPPYPSSDRFKSTYMKTNFGNPQKSETPVQDTTYNYDSRSPSSSGRQSSSSPRFEESSTKRVFKTESSSSSTRNKDDISPAFKSIQDKIDAFKKEFEDIENKMTKKSDLSKIIKKTTNVEKKTSNVEYVSRSGTNIDEIDQYSPRSPTSQPIKVTTTTKTYTSPKTSRPTSSSPTETTRNDIPKSSIRSLSKKFENLGHEDSENFKRKTEAKRKEFFDQIKHQVRETRKELDGFDPIDDEDELDISQRVYSKPTMGSTSTRQSSGFGSSSLLSGGKPKVYTRRETTQEETVSKVVKENDKIIQNETKRNVERSSSFHGSSDEDETSIKHLDRKLRTSPNQRTESPVDEVKRRCQIAEPELRGAGLMARTLYDYQASEPDELTFDVDDLITNIEKVDSGWFKGTITYKGGRKREGLFPANYVKLLNDSDEY